MNPEITSQQPQAGQPCGLSVAPCSAFSVHRRNPGHWDISDDRRRIFRIRGGPGKYCVLDERVPHQSPRTDFKTVGACIGYICDELMTELIVAEGQHPTVIESWNV